MRISLSEKTTERIRIWLLLTPALLVVVLLFLGGLVTGLMRSFGFMPLIGLVDFNLNAYSSILTDDAFLWSFALTFYIAFTSTAIASTLAVASALLLRRAFRGKRIVSFMFQLNLTIPHLVGAIGILYLFSQSGLLARLAAAANLIVRPSDFPALVFDKYAVAIILEYVWKEIPFIGVIVLAMLQSVGENYEAVAQSLGANRWQTFRNVTLPLVMPGVSMASVIVFAFTFGAFEIPFVLGRNFPAALPVLAYRSYVDVDLAARPQAMAMAMVIAFVAMLVVLAYMSLSRRYIRS